MKDVGDVERLARVDKGVAGGGDPGAKVGVAGDDMVTGDVIFAATGVTDGSLLPGVKRTPTSITVETVLMRSKTGSVRRMSYTNPVR